MALSIRMIMLIFLSIIRP
uniref:Uncharacterized protein n=1 Tax=Rhizophora mucronata TaxID=61149 RepID=A0A2P2NNW3_RHIMU